MKLWLDLEQTIISIWHDPEIVNQEKVVRFCKDNRIEWVNIFSFAIWNEKDRTHFNTHMRGWLEREFGFKIGIVHTCEELMREIFWKHGTVFELGEFTSIWGKEKAFNDYIRLTQKSGHFVLIDDMVDDTVMYRIREDQQIRTINVDRLQ